jgi:hypothetical protein
MMLRVKTILIRCVGSIVIDVSGIVLKSHQNTTTLGFTHIEARDVFCIR